MAWALVRPAHADPITATIATVASWIVANPVTATILAVSAATTLYTLSVLKGLPSAGKQGTTVPSVGSDQAIRHVVGQTLVAGHACWRHSSGDENEWFFESRVVSYGPIESFEEIRLGDFALTFSSMTNSSDGFAPTNSGSTLSDAGLPEDISTAAYFEVNTGVSSEPVGPMLQAWGGAASTARHQPFATLSFRIKAEPFELRMPQVTTVIKGRKCYDPREESHDVDDETTWDWTTNPALIAAWYIMQPWSFAAVEDEVDWTTVSAAASICEEQVLKADGVTYEDRYAMGGEISEDEDRNKVLEQIVLSMAGWFVEPKPTGKWQFFAGAYQTPVLDIVDDDIGTGSYSPAGNDARSRFTLVRGTFQDPDASYKANSYPEVFILPALAREVPEFQTWLDDNPGATDAEKRTQAATYRHLIHTLDMAYVQSSDQAQRIAHIKGMEAYYQKTWDGRVGGIGLIMPVAQNVTLTDSRYSLDELVVKVIKTAQEDQSTSLSLVEDSSEVYVTPTLEAQPEVVAPSLPRPVGPGNTDTPDGGGTADLVEAF